jgi:hypothetical protein
MVWRTTPARFVLTLTAALYWVSPGGAADPPSLNDLSMEVSALYTLYQFQLSPAQMEKLRRLARETAEKPGARQAPKASDEYRKTLGELRDALVSADDGDLIGALQEKLDELAETEKPEVDGGFEVTDAARRCVPELFRLLTARQVVAFVAAYGDQFPDPNERLLEALDKVRDLKPREWKELREDLSEEVGHLVAGLDPDKAVRVGDKVVQWLITVRALTEDEFKTQRPELEKRAREIVGDVAPLDVIRHAVEYALAELLSNPRLGEALAARLK